MIFFTVYVVDLNFSFEGATDGNSIKCLHNSFLQKEVKDKRPQHFFEKKKVNQTGERYRLYYKKKKSRPDKTTVQE